MKTIFTLFFAFLVGSASAQQVTLDPVNMGEGVLVRGSAMLGDDYVVAGNLSAGFETGFVSRISGATGFSVWTKAIDSPWFSQVFDLSVSGDDIVVAGEIGSNDGTDGVVMKFDQDGSVLWSKVFTTDSAETFRSVSTDAVGNVYVFGFKGTSSTNRREVLMKLDPSGNMVWSKQWARTPGNSHYGYRVRYQGDSLFVFGQTLHNARDIYLGVFSAATGNLLTYKVFGDWSNEGFLDAKVDASGIYFTFTSSNASGLIQVARVSHGTLALAGSPQTLYPTMGGLMSSGIITLDDGDVYVGGGWNSGFVPRSFLVKMNSSLAVEWAKFLTEGVAPSVLPFTSSAFVVNGGVAVVDARSNQSVLTELSPAGQMSSAYCNQPEPFECWVLGGWVMESNMTSNLFFQGYSPTSTSLLVSDRSIMATPCGLTVLNVSLLDFTGHKEGYTSVLRWDVAGATSEIFHIERLSPDGWEDIGSVPATVGGSSYSFVDESPLTGENYYRLRIVYGSIVNYSDVVVVIHDESEGLVLCPNPSSGAEGVNLRGQLDELHVYDQAGREVQHRLYGSKLFVNAQTGVYQVVTSSSSGERKVARLVIN